MYIITYIPYLILYFTIYLPTLELPLLARHIYALIYALLNEKVTSFKCKNVFSDNYVKTLP